MKRKARSRSSSAAKPCSLLSATPVNSAGSEQRAHLIRQPGFAPHRFWATCRELAKPLQVQHPILVDQECRRKRAHAVGASGVAVLVHERVQIQTILLLEVLDL